MSTLDLRISNGVATHTIAVSDSTPMIQRAQDATAAINAAFGLTTFKVIWGFRIVAGFNDEIRHAANLNGTATNVISTIAPGDYGSGAALAAAMQTAMQAAEDAFPGGKRVDIVCTYSEASGRFNWAWTQVRATISQFFVRGTPPSYLVTALPTVGIQMGADQVGAGANGNFDGDYEVRVRRFGFAFAGAAGSVRLAEAAFTAEPFFGITDTTNKTILFYLCNLEMTDPAPPPPPPPQGSITPTIPQVWGGGAAPDRVPRGFFIPKSRSVEEQKVVAQQRQIDDPGYYARALGRQLQARMIAASEGEVAAARWLREQADADKKGT